jgi:predicted DNA-binding ribbon-helix-helix protein
MTQQRNKRSLTIARHRTSVSLEEPFWIALAEIAEAEGKSVASLVGEIDKRRGEESGGAVNLSAAIRLYVLERAKDRRGPLP